MLGESDPKAGSRSKGCGSQETDNGDGQSRSALDLLSVFGLLMDPSTLGSAAYPVLFILERGTCFVVEPGASARFAILADAHARLVVISNTTTLSDMIRGTFDPRCPRPEHLFVWRGDEAILSAINHGNSTRYAHVL
jgi:hypothetical protein